MPGGDVSSALADALTGQIADIVPASLLLLLALVVVVWFPFRRSVIGRAVYAVGSSEVAAYMSGVPIRRAKFVAYTLSGLLAMARRSSCSSVGRFSFGVFERAHPNSRPSAVSWW